MSGMPNVLELVTMDLISAGELQHLENIKRRWDRYYGKYPDPLKRKANEPDYNVKANKAKVIVNTSVFFLFGRDLAMTLSDESSNEEAQAHLERTWLLNRQMSLLTKVAMNGSVTGHAFIRLYPPTEERDYIRLITVPSETVTPTWDDNDIDDVVRWRIQWNTVDRSTTPPRPAIRRQLFIREGAQWVIMDQIALVGARNFRDLSPPEIWPFSWPPIFHCQNLPVPNEFWGLSDIEDDVLSLVRSKNLNSSLWLKTQVYYNNPMTWIRGVTGEIDPTKTIELGTSGEIGVVERQSDGAAQERIDEHFDQQIAEVSQTPLVALGQMDKLGPVSGVALQIQYQPLIQKTEMKRRLYGDMITELNARILELGDYSEQGRVSLGWRDVLPRNELEESQVALNDLQIGVSTETLQERRGYNPDVENDRRAAGNAELGEALLAEFDRGTQ